MAEYQNFASNVRSRRIALGLTQQQLAEKLYVTAQNVSKWECGTAYPDLPKLCRLSEVLDATPDMLLGIGGKQNAYIGIDGGGTKTEFVLFTDSGEVVRRFRTGGANPNSCGMDTAMENLTRGIDTVNDGRYELKGIFAGIAGSLSGGNGVKIRDMLCERYPEKQIEVNSDIMNVAFLLPDDSDRIVVISGTGSVVYSRVGGELHRLGGWGYLFDNAGSGYDIGRDAIRAVLAKDDGMGENSLLCELVEQKLGGKVWEKLDLLYSGGKDYIASFAGLVFQAYRQGDSHAAAIIRRSTDRLSELICEMYRRYPTCSNVIFAGGICSDDDILREYFKKTIPESLNLLFPKEPPIYGACAYCVKQFGNPVPNFYENLKISLQGANIVC